MKTSNPSLNPCAPPEWEYVVEDLLEMKSTLTSDERRRLLRELRGRKPVCRYIDVHPAFSLEKQAVLVLKDSGINECWIYRPGERSIRKISLR